MSKQLINSAYHVEHLKTVLDSAFHNKLETQKASFIIDSDGSVSILITCKDFTISIIYLIAVKKYRVSFLVDGIEKLLFFSNGAELETDLKQAIEHTLFFNKISNKIP